MIRGPWFREAVIHRYFLKKMFLKISQYSHEKKLVLESLFNKAPGLKDCNLIKKRVQQSCFPVNIAKLSSATYFN